MKRLAIAVFAAAVAWQAGDALAGPPRLEKIVISDAKDGPQKTVFKPTTPKVYVRAALVDVPAGTKLRGEWIAVKTGVAPPNYKVDTAENKIGKGAETYTFSMSKPNAGWPEGDYRVDLFLDDKPAGKVPFKIAK